MRRPVVSYAFAIFTFLGISCASQAQETSHDPVQFVPRVDVSLGYQFIHANAPPGGSDMFNLNGGYASVGVKYKYWLSFAGDVTGTRASRIGTLGQNLTLLTYTAGPRVTFRRKHTVPFAEATFGAAHGSDSYFPTGNSYTTSATSFALTAGGGLDLELNHRFAIRAIQAEYLHTGFHNGVNTSQNQLMLGAGLLFKFHSRYAQPHPHKANAAPMPPPAIMPVAGVVPPAPAAPLVLEDNAAPTPEGGSFHDHVRDVYFDYDKWDLRPDAQQGILEAASYLQAHPALRVMVGGYSDERGTPDYNLSLGEKRANATRDALLKAGLDPGRITVVSYGKGVQVCTTAAEPCYQRNRRAAFMPQP